MPAERSPSPIVVELHPLLAAVSRLVSASKSACAYKVTSCAPAAAGRVSPFPRSKPSAITRAPMLCAICTKEKSHAPGGGVNQRRLALLKGISIVREIMGRHPLQHDGSSLLFAHALRNRHQGDPLARQHIRHTPPAAPSRPRDLPLTDVVSAPTSVTTPAPSCPGTKGSGDL